MATILVAEYDGDWQNVIGSVLRNRGHILGVVGLYEEALSEIRKQPYEFYVLGDVKSEAHLIRDPTESRLTIMLFRELIGNGVPHNRIAVLSQKSDLLETAHQIRAQPYKRNTDGKYPNLTQLVWDIESQLARR